MLPQPPHLVQVRPEELFKSITVESEQALHAIHVLSSCILIGILLEVTVHLVIEVVAQEVTPETKQRVHLLGLADTCQDR